MPDQPQTNRWHQFNLKTIMCLVAVVALPLAIWQFRKNRARQFANAAQPFEDLGAVVASNPKSFSDFLMAYLFLGSDHLVSSISFMDEPLTDQQLESMHYGY
jgi:hypothetical protein